MPPKKPYPSHGVLNDIHKPVVQDRVDVEGGSVSGIFRKMADRFYTPDSITNTGPYKAIVLRVEKGSVEGEAGSWRSSFYNFFGISSPAIRIKARVPELHSMLPVPNSLGYNSDEGAIIEMYPTFVSQNENTEKPSEGDLVWVDFGNKTNFTDPIYLKPVMSTKNPVGGGGTLSSKSAYAAPCNNALNSSIPKGDTLSGKNKSLSHTGLPLSPRTTKETYSKEHKIIRGNRASAQIVTEWEKAVTEQNVPGTSWIGGLQYNGREDAEHKRGKRDTIIYSPSITEFNSPIEIMYFFHGIKEFSREFKKRYAPEISKLINQKRNFVLVIPELPWSQDVEGDVNKRQGLVWKGNDNFTRFHNEVLGILRTSFSGQLDVTYISIVAFSAGGSALKEIANNKSLLSVVPNKIVMVSCDYYDVAKDVWEQYVKFNENVEFDILTEKKGKPFLKAKEFLKELGQKGNTSHLFVQSFNKSHAQMGNMALSFVNQKSVEENNKKVKKDIEEMETNPPDPEEGDFSLTGNPDLSIPKNMPPFKPGARLPLGKNADIAPSGIKKTSTTKKQLPSGVQLKEAVPFAENRVFLKDYGSLSPNSDVLIKIPSSFSIRAQHIHKLVLSRLAALNDAWVSENPGVEPLKVISGWRKHRWASREQYEQYVIKEYGSVAEGRKWLAYASPHETGLAIDFGNNGLYPSRKTNFQQKQTKAYKWLVNNAHKFGFSPYEREAWHFECKLPRASWASGEEFTDNYAVRVVNPGDSESFPTSGNGGISLASNVCTKTMGDFTG